jgi:hypothetical protein
MYTIATPQAENGQFYNARAAGETQPFFRGALYPGTMAPLPLDDNLAMGREASGFLNEGGMNPWGQFDQMAASPEDQQSAGLLSQMCQMFMGIMSMFQQWMNGGQDGLNNAAGLDGADTPPVADTDNKLNGGALNRANDADALQGGTALGERIAKRAEADAAAYNTPGMCLQEVGKVLREFGIPVNRHPAAWQALPDLQKSNKVKEISVGKDQLDKLPAGAIVVWDKGAGLPYGHISIALGDGREASSKLRQQLHLNTSYHVFIPAA